MSFAKRHRYGIVLFVICIFMLLASAYIGYSLSRADKSDDDTLTANVGDKTAADCIITLNAAYANCSHKLKSEVPVMPGLTLNDLKEEFPAYSFVDFSSKQITASVRLNAYCPEHCLLKLESDGMLWVYKTVENTEIQENAARYKDFNIEPEQLNLLKTGKLFSSMDDLIEYIKKINL